MFDEFPTLEAALAISIIVLVWRFGLLLRALRRASQSQHDDLQRNARRLARSLGRAGTDLVIAAILASALMYAQAKGFGVRPAFYVLGVAAVTLLVASSMVHARLARLSRARLSRLKAPAETPEHPHRAAREHASAATTQKAATCPACGSRHLTVLSSADELSKKLAAIGVESSSLCTECGHLEGRARSGTW